MEGNNWSEVRHEHTNKVEIQRVHARYRTGRDERAECCVVRQKKEIAHERNAHVAVGNTKDEVESCEKCRHLERDNHVLTRWQSSSERRGWDGFNKSKSVMKRIQWERYYRCQ